MENAMAMSLEEAKRLTNKRLAEQRKGYLSENAYRQSPEFKEKIKNRLVSIAEATTPLGDVQTARDAKKAYDEGRYLDALGNAGMIAAGYTPLAPLAKGAKALNQANKYRKFKNEAARRGGPLSPHYMEIMTGNPRMDRIANQNIANMRSDVTDLDYPHTKGISDLDQALIDSDPRFKDARFAFTGQNEGVAYDIADLVPPKNYKGSHLFLGKEPPVGSDYALKANLFKKRTNLNEPPEIESRGKLIAIPFSKDAPLDDLFETTRITGNRKTIKDSSGNEIGSEANPRINNREQMTIPMDRLAELKQYVIGGKGLVLPPGAGKDNQTMATIKRLMKEGKYNAIE